MSQSINILGKKYWESLYENDNKNYSDNIVKHQREQRRKIIEKYIGQEFKIIEVGCGEGDDIIGLKDLSNSLYGLDYSYNALRFLKDGDVNTICADIHNIPFKNDKFDLVYNSGVIEHFENPFSPLREMIRITKSDGYIIVFVPNTISFWVVGKHMLNILHTIFPIIKPWPIWERSFNFIELNRMSKKLKLKDVNIEGIHLLHYYYIIHMIETRLGHSILPERLKKYIIYFLKRLDERSQILKLYFGMEIVLTGRK